MLRTTEQAPIEQELESYRKALTGYCYRMIGSGAEAEDAVQETMVRAWKSADKLQDRAALKAWLFRIANNVCLDMLGSAQRRATPMDMGPSSDADAPLGAMLADSAWVRPIADAKVLEPTADPAELAAEKETLRLAFVAALQHLPAKQRAVLILREVLAWRASEVAELLGTSVASVNSALQRARATLAENGGTGADAATSDPLDEEQQKLLERYVEAFEGYDMTALTALLHEDAVMTMPPFDLWLRGTDDITGFMTTLGAACAGSRLVPVEVNGLPGFAQYKPDEDGRGFSAWSVQVLEISKGRVSGFHFFLDTARWFPLFDLPLHLEAESD